MISGGLSVQGNLELWLRGVSPLKMYRIKRQILCERKCTKTTSLMLGVLRLLRATKKLASNNPTVYRSLHKSTRARRDAPQLSTWKQKAEKPFPERRSIRARLTCGRRRRPASGRRKRSASSASSAPARRRSPSYNPPSL